MTAGIMRGKMNYLRSSQTALLSLETETPSESTESKAVTTSADMTDRKAANEELEKFNLAFISSGTLVGGTRVQKN